MELTKNLIKAKAPRKIIEKTLEHRILIIGLGIMLHNTCCIKCNHAEKIFIKDARALCQCVLYSTIDMLEIMDYGCRDINN